MVVFVAKHHPISLYYGVFPNYHKTVLNGTGWCCIVESGKICYLCGVKNLRYGLRLLCGLWVAVFCACSSTKHVPAGEYLLDKVSIDVERDSGDVRDIRTEELYNFLRQTPNHKVLGFARLQLATYSLSGRDSTKWYNRWLRKIGQPPVIYDDELTEASARQLRQAMINKGYMDATVTIDTAGNTARKRMQVRYDISPGRPHTIGAMAYDIPDSAIRRIVLGDTARLVSMQPGALFDRNALDNDRALITERLRNHGYYGFNREYITFVADTAAGCKEVFLTMNIHAPRTVTETADSAAVQRRYYFRHIYYVLADEDTPASERDTVSYRSIHVIYGPDHYLKPSILYEKCYLNPGAPYSSRAVDRTYEALSRMNIIKFINIELEPVGSLGADAGLLDAYIMLSRNKKQGVSVELEGTNSEGDLGFGVGLTYQHRNLAHGSQLLTAKLRASYESLSGNFDDLINDRYTELASEVSITFPKFECPFLSRRFKQRILANTEFAVSFNYQERPEYTRYIVGAAWKWKWQQQLRNSLRRHTYDLVDLNIVRLPRSTLNFIDEIAPTNPLLRYSYEDHFIMRMGYSFYRTNRRIPSAGTDARYNFQPTVTTLRLSSEIAGNLLYAISSAVGQHRSDGAYKIFGIQYAQYAKAELDYTYVRNFNTRNSIALHGGFGLAYPYGNSRMVPFEKRFYAGGANGVRGWAVRTLGPGSYDAKNSVTDFINQCGDIRLDLSVEYRAKLFWVIEGALFVDAGNIWTIHNYPNQPGGFFRFRNFYKELAAAYGVGIRLDFTYFLLRLDLGLKAHNPAMNQERWPIIHPRWGRDANFHFSVGYPF